MMSLVEALFKILSLLAEPLPLVEGHWRNVTFNVPILVDISVPVTEPLRLVYIVESILILFGNVFMIYFSHFINKLGVVHLHLQQMFMVFTSLYVVASFARFYMILVQLRIVTDLDTPYLLCAGIIRMQHYGMAVSAVLVITVERAFATYYVLDYESKTRNWVTVVCIFVGLIYTQFFVIPICFFKASLNYIIFFTSSWEIVANFVLLGLYRFNIAESKKLSWKAEKLKGVNYTLGKKFQVEENVKIIKLLIVLSFTILLFLIILILLLVLPRLFSENEKSHKASQVQTALFDLILALGAIFIPFFSMWQLQKTRDLPFTENIKCVKKRREERQIANVIKIEDVTKSYFEQFHTSWR